VGLLTRNQERTLWGLMLQMISQLRQVTDFGLDWLGPRNPSASKFVVPILALTKRAIRGDGERMGRTL
jgi:hypothetical protein